ncbi:MAG: MATE family efflux transporter [Zoogloeaceae bacterium]|nr:MATE family efflux transporter [Zoogloeaceae bacterium]
MSHSASASTVASAAASAAPLTRLLRLAWPVLVAQLVIAGNGLIDTIMAGRLSALDLAAVGVGASIYITIFVTAMGVLMALTPVAAQHYGAGRYADIGEDVRQCGWLALLVALLGMLLLRYPEPFIALAKLTPAMEDKVRAYLRALSWSMIPGLAFRVFYGLMTGIGRPRAIMVFNVIFVAAKVPLNALFVYGLGMGAAGCGVATAVISWPVGVLAWAWYAARGGDARYGVLARFSWPRPAALLELVRIGLPIGLTMLVDVTAFTFMALFIARLGPGVAAAHQIAASVTVLTYMIPLSIGQAALVLAGHALGAGEAARARRTGLTGIALGAAVAALVSVGLWFGAAHIAALYTPDAAVRQAAAALIALVAVYHFVDAFQAVVVNILRGYKRTLVPMLLYVVALWGVGLAGGYLLGLTDLLGPARGAAGFWLAAAAALTLASGGVLAYFLTVSRAALPDAAV